MPAKLALMLEISRKEIYTDGLKIIVSQELLPVSLETRIKYGGSEITSTPYGCTVIWYSWTRFCPKTKKGVPDISRPKKCRHYYDAMDEREISRLFSDSRAFMAVPVSYI